MLGGINPYWWMGPLPVTQQSRLPRIDVGGIYALATNAVALSTDGTTVDYGINPCQYNMLPSRSLVLLTISDDAPTGSAALPATLVVPNSGSSTVSGSGTSTASGTTKVNIVDSQGNNVTGSNIQGNTQRLVYINKCTGTIRFMEFTNATT